MSVLPRRTAVRQPMPRGPGGVRGPIPNHEIESGTPRFRIQLPDGSFGPWINPLGPQGPDGDAQTFATRAIAALSMITAGVEAIRTSGYTAAGDGGGAMYVHASGSTTGGFQSADGQWWQLAELVVNVKHYGAKGDDSNDDTAAINLAISIANANFGFLYFPTGTYLVAPGGLSEIHCSVYGPSAILKASTNISSPVVSVSYWDGLGFGSQSASFVLGRIQGYGQSCGVGLYGKSVINGRFQIGRIQQCEQGLWLDGSADNGEISNCIVDIGEIAECGNGILLTSATTGSWKTEANRFNIKYMQNFTSAAIRLGGLSSVNQIAQNVFDVISIEVNHLDGYGIILDDEAIANEFNLRSLGVVSGTGKMIYTSAASLNNIFRVPVYDTANMDLNGNNVFDVAEILYGVTSGTGGRSNLLLTAPPSGGRHRRGDRAWNIAPSAGGAPGWVCVADGTPGTWKAMPNLAA